MNREALTSPKAAPNQHASRWGSINPKVEIRDPKEARSPKSEGQPISRTVIAFRSSVFGFLSGFGLRASGFAPVNSRRRMNKPEKQKSIEQEAMERFPRTSCAPCAPERCVAQTFLSAGSGDFPVASPCSSAGNAGQECPANSQTGMSALQGSWAGEGKSKIPTPKPKTRDPKSKTQIRGLNSVAMRLAVESVLRR